MGSHPWEGNGSGSSKSKVTDPGLICGMRTLANFFGLFFLPSALTVPLELKDDGEGLTGPEPSIVGSVDKVLKNVNKFDQYECLQKMICEAMGTAEKVGAAVINSQIGQQGSQFAQNGFSQLQSNPNQFVQNQINHPGPIVQAATAQLNPGTQHFLQSGQQVLQSGQQFFSTGQNFVQQLPQNQFQTSFGSQNQFGQTFIPQNQINRFYLNQLQQNQQFGQSQLSQNQFSQSPSTGDGGLVDSLVDGLAGVLAHVPLPGRRRKKRQTTMHGQAIRLLNSLGLNNMGAYPYVVAAIRGHAMRDAPQSCQEQYRNCPNEYNQLLNYFNNHNGGLGQTVVPAVTNEVGGLFPGLAALPQVAASTFSELASSDSGSGGLVNSMVDGLAGLIAKATLPKPSSGKKSE